MALKDDFSGAPWSQWPSALKKREPNALEEARTRLSRAVQFWKGVQYLFFRQWKSLKAYANENGIQMIGDLPIYTAADSADIWAAPRSSSWMKT